MTGDIFKDDGKGGLEFVGDFDGLYVRCSDPWGQGGTREDIASYYSFSRHRLAMALTALVGRSEGCRLEIGCGHGHAMNAVAKAIGGTWTGIDISHEAVKRARELYPEHRFHTSDIRGGLPFPPSSVGRFDVVILSQILWYILDRPKPAIANAIRLTRTGGLLVVSQAFLRKQLYGTEIIDGFAGALAWFATVFPQELALIESRYDDTETFIHHDGLLIFRKVGSC
jgi:SAM-dependent methyltransferase